MNKEFCERLKMLRKQNKMSLGMLAKSIGVNQSTIIRWENGEIVPNIEKLYNIATFFKVKTDYLLGLNNNL